MFAAIRPPFPTGQGAPIAVDSSVRTSMPTPCLHGAGTFPHRRRIIQDMLRHLSRALLALTAFFALQGSILGSAAACALMEHRTQGAGAMSEMSDVSSEQVSSANAPSSGRDASCEHGTAPDCAAMPLCAAFVESAAVRLYEASALVTRVGPMIASAPAYLAPPPEIPPPRA